MDQAVKSSTVKINMKEIRMCKTHIHMTSVPLTSISFPLYDM